jgi:hypothetical protein
LDKSKVFKLVPGWLQEQSYWKFVCDNDVLKINVITENNISDIDKSENAISNNNLSENDISCKNVYQNNVSYQIYAESFEVDT